MIFFNILKCLKNETLFYELLAYVMDGTQTCFPFSYSNVLLLLFFLYFKTDISNSNWRSSLKYKHMSLLRDDKCAALDTVCAVYFPVRVLH
jgi:hypothetical protein